MGHSPARRRTVPPADFIEQSAAATHCQEYRFMKRWFASAAGVAAALLLATPVAAQKSGGVLHLYHRDSPASMSILEEATISAVVPTMAVFNNLVLYDQHVAQNSLKTIVPDLADSWSWNG